MKTRITNVLTATLWLLLIAVWLPTFWALAQLPGTWDGHKSSALLRYVEDELGTVYYRIDDPPVGKYTYLRDSFKKPVNKDPKNLSTRINDWFIPFVVFTLLVLGGQYMLTGGLTLRSAREKEDTQT